MIPTPTFRTLAEREVWWREHVVELNRLSVTDPQEWERLTIRIEGLLAAIARREREAA